MVRLSLMLFPWGMLHQRTVGQQGAGSQEPAVVSLLLEQPQGLKLDFQSLAALFSPSMCFKKKCVNVL